MGGNALRMKARSANAAAETQKTVPKSGASPPATEIAPDEIQVFSERRPLRAIAFVVVQIRIRPVRLNLKEPTRFRFADGT